MHLLSMIERHLRNSGVAATRFGRDAVNDPRFVLDLRNGREPRPSTAERVSAYIARCDRIAPR
jgi:2,4-dienoyl-CoA reductase-like NADH-dependent reductase (Old Yellow Enzyme family)